MSSRIAGALLSRGMFPRDLPPPFSSAALGKQYKNLSTVLPTTGLPRTRPDRFSLPKAALGRRTALIVNPVAYFALSKTIADNWKEIRTRLVRSPISAYTPKFSGKERALLDIDFRSIRERRIIESSGHSFVLNTDFARFFPTIYTHSIPWALHTKKVAKASGRNSTLPGDQLDKAVMALQDGQTAGIPIGPDASYILAELVAVAVDRRFRDLLNNEIFGIRYVDDYTLYFPTRTSAEIALSCLAQAAAEFQLELNPEKTWITNIAAEHPDSWTFSLQAFSLPKNADYQRPALARLTELAISLHSKHGDASIGRYAIKKISSTLLDPKHIDFAVACVLRLSRLSPTALSDVAAFICSYARMNFPVAREPIKRFIENTTTNGLVILPPNLGHPAKRRALVRTAPG